MWRWRQTPGDDHVNGRPAQNSFPREGEVRMWARAVGRAPTSLPAGAAGALVYPLLPEGYSEPTDLRLRSDPSKTLPKPHPSPIPNGLYLSIPALDFTASHQTPQVVHASAAAGDSLGNWMSCTKTNCKPSSRRL